MSKNDFKLGRWYDPGMTGTDYSKVGCVVLDAFGTIARLTKPTQPYSLLRGLIAKQNIAVDNFAVRAMTGRSTLYSMALECGADIPVKQMCELESLLFEDLTHMEVNLGAVEAIKCLAGLNIRVVIGSNLALPYGVVLESMLRGQGVALEEMSPISQVAHAFSYNVGSVKPSPLFYEAIETQMSVGSSSCLMVGDKTLEDQQGPQARGLQAEPAFNRAELEPQLWIDWVSCFKKL